MQQTDKNRQKNQSTKNTKSGFYNVSDCYDAPPLDYSYRNVTDLADLKNIEPRTGTASKQKAKMEEKEVKSDAKLEEEEK